MFFALLLVPAAEENKFKEYTVPRSLVLIPFVILILGAQSATLQKCVFVSAISRLSVPEKIDDPPKLCKFVIRHEGTSRGVISSF